MKKILSTVILISLVFILSNCGSDKPDDLPVSLNGSASVSFSLISAANTQQAPSVTLSLKDFSGISKYVDFVEKGSVIATSFVEVKGITSTQNVKLTNVSLEMKSDSRKSLKLGDIETNVKILANTAEELIFLQNIMDETVRRGSSTIVLKYTPTTNMTNENVKLSLNFNTQFIFN